MEEKDLPAVLLTSYEKSLIFQRLVPVGCERSQEVRTPQTNIVNDQIVQVEAMDSSACNLAGKLEKLKDVAEENTIVRTYSSSESVID